MSSRNHKNFIDSYFKYARDGFAPDSFHIWTGLSILAAVLERKVWLEQPLAEASLMHYPNIYVMLVSHPQVGKSTALNRGMALLDELKDKHSPEFKIISNQGTEPGLVETMKINRALQIGALTVRYSSGFFCASEASASALQNTCGDYIATLTELYDCPRWFRKTLKSGETEIPNICFNLLVGSTFNYLKTLVNEESALGGFASRCIYVVAKDRKVREAKWKTESRIGQKMFPGLVADLAHIHKLQGEFKPTPEFIARWEAWQPEFDRWLISLKSPRMEGINARKGAHLMKTAMLMSVAERDDLVLTEEHWDRALALVEDVTKDNAFILSSALMANIDSQAGINQIILQNLKVHGGSMKIEELRNEVSKSGTDVARFDGTLKFLRESNQLDLHVVGNLTQVKLLIDPDTRL